MFGGGDGGRYYTPKMKKKKWFLVCVNGHLSNKRYGYGQTIFTIGWNEQSIVIVVVPLVLAMFID